MEERTFPKDFAWGTATAAYQIEGAYSEDGRGESIWDRFSKTPGKVFQGHTGDVACDHYHRYQQDVKIMADIGVAAYRFSIAWPRIFPEKGKPNEKGLDFYKRLLETLHHHNIQPTATLYHWDLPQYLEDEGGWPNRDTAHRFADYAETVYRHLGDGISQWITHNEPWCAAWLGYGMGHHAPGLTDWRKAVAASHTLLYSHGLAVEAYRASGMKGEIGISLNLGYADPATDSPEDVAAARRFEGFSNRWFLDPVFRGAYPPDIAEIFERVLAPLDFSQPGDLKIISTPIDFLGVNYYTRSVVKHNADDPYLGAQIMPIRGAVTDMGWEVHPHSLYRLLKSIEDNYTKLPIYITENGAAYPDKLEAGQIHDEDRIRFLRDHFSAALQFIEEGGNLKGYYVWSFMDNFEWAFGYDKRFGIVYVDYETQERILKDSAKWYQRVIAENAIV